MTCLQEHRKQNSQKWVGQAQGPELVIPTRKFKPMDKGREVLRVKHYAIRTEQGSCEWLRGYVPFRGMRSREDLFPGTD